MFEVVRVPEPFRSALLEARPTDVANELASTPEELYGRALARMDVGRENDARADLEAAEPGLGDACAIELACLDLQQRSDVKGALAAARAVAQRAADGSSLRARALHVVGLAEGKVRRTRAAVDALLRALEIYSTLDIRRGSAAVYDTLGMVEKARGRVDYAFHCFALSLVDKTLLGDLRGMSITLGNLGRAHLDCGRFRDAVRCFERDLEISTKLGDERGRVRMLEDLARAYMGVENFEQAESTLRECLQAAQSGGFGDLEFFASKDLALVQLRRGRVPDAERALAAARKLLPSGGEPYFELLLKSVEGELLVAKRDERAIDRLSEAVQGFSELHLPDQEIDARISLSRAFIDWNLTASAEQCLLDGLRLARRDGYARYLPRLNQTMAELDLVEGALEESGRDVSKGSVSRESTSYVVRETLGSGAFGEVFRVYDPERGQDVALKRLRVEQLYDGRKRERLIRSARTELEAASRIRHPGVVRVLALGTDPEGGFYVVQELVEGRPLSESMTDEPAADASDVLRCLAMVARALHALHAAGVVHRDLKPANVVLRHENGRPVLVDFGIASMADGRRELARIAGTLPYMSPEQALGRRQDGRSDLYALGVIAYQWLSGVLPIRPRGQSFEEIARDIATRKPPSLSEHRPDTSQSVEDLVMTLLAKKPRRRPQTAEAAARALEGLVDARGRVGGSART